MSLPNTTPTTNPHILASRAKWEKMDRTQEAFNRAVSAGELRDPAGAIRVYLDAEHLDFPQYRGHWNSWVLVRIKARTTGKGGVMFEAGDYTLGKWTPSFLPGEGRWTCHSIRLGWDCSMGPCAMVEEVK